MEMVTRSGRGGLGSTSLLRPFSSLTSFPSFMVCFFSYQLISFHFNFNFLFLTLARKDWDFNMDIKRRQDAESSTDKFLDLIADPFQAQVRHISPFNASNGETDIYAGPRKFHLRS